MRRASRISLFDASRRARDVPAAQGGADRPRSAPSNSATAVKGMLAGRGTQLDALSAIASRRERGVQFVQQRKGLGVSLRRDVERESAVGMRRDRFDGISLEF